MGWKEHGEPKTHKPNFVPPSQKVHEVVSVGEVPYKELYNAISENVSLNEEVDKLEKALLSLNSELDGLKTFMRNEIGIKIQESIEHATDVERELRERGISNVSTKYIDLVVPHYKMGIRCATEVLEKIQTVCR